MAKKQTNSSEKEERKVKYHDVFKPNIEQKSDAVKSQQYVKKKLPEKIELTQQQMWDLQRPKYVLYDTKEKPSSDTRTSAQRNADYWDPVKGASERNKSKMDNGKHPIQGLAKTVGTSALIATGALELPALATWGGLGARALVGGAQGLGYGNIGLGTGNPVDDFTYGAAGEVGIPLAGKLIQKPITKSAKYVDVINTDVIKPDDVHKINSNISELERLGIPKGERNQWLKGRTADKAQDVAIGLNNPNYSQSVRDAHFMQTTPENTLILDKDIPLELHHATDENFTKFNINKTKRGKTEGKGIYTSTEYLPGYGNIDMKLYGYVKQPFNKTAERSSLDALGGHTNNQYWNTDLIDSRIEFAEKNIKNQPMSYKYYSSPELPPFGINKEYLLDNTKKVFKVGEYSKKGYQNYLKNIEIFKEKNLNEIIELKGLKNSDGIVINWTNYIPEIVTLPERVKTTSAITYDDLGNIIPLSKRDNFKINDIRYKSGGNIKYTSQFKLGGAAKILETGGTNPNPWFKERGQKNNNK